MLFIYWETALCKAVGWGPWGPGRQHTCTDSNILSYRSSHSGFAKAPKCRFFFVQVRKLSHRSFVTDQTSESQDPDRSCLRQLTHTSLCARAPLLLETSGGGSLLGHLLPFRLSAFFSSLLLGFGWDSAAAAGLATTSLAADFCPVPIETVLWESWGWWWGWGRLHCHFYYHSSNTHCVEGFKTTTCMPPVRQPPSPHVMGSLGRSLWHGARWEDIIPDGPPWTGRKGSRIRRRRSCKVMQAWQALLEPLWGSELRLSVQDKMIRLSTSTMMSCFMSGAHRKGITLGIVALPLRPLLQGWRLQSVCVPHSHQLGNTSFLERKFGHYNSTSGFWDNTVKAGTTLLQRFLAHCIDTLRSSIIMGDTQGKVSTKMSVS